MLTKEQLEQALPTTLKSAATQSLADKINNAVTDPLVAEQIRENFVTYAGVLREGKFKTEDYLNAIKYVSFKMMGHTNQDSYLKTFPLRHQDFITKGMTSKEISPYVAAYHKGKMVNLIMEQAVIPSWLLNQDAYQKAINIQMEIMTTSSSDKVRSDAANSILTHLKRPETKEMNISLDVKDNSGIQELKDALGKMAQGQLEAIKSGVSTQQIAALPIIEAEYTEVVPDKAGGG